MNIKYVNLLLLGLSLSVNANTELVAAKLQKKSNNYQVKTQIMDVLFDPLADNQTRVSYTYPEANTIGIKVNEKQVIQSNEYWQHISGAELNKGIEIYISSEQSMLRIAPKTGSKFSRKVSNIDTQALSYNKLPLSASHNMQQLASQKEMELAGFSDGSIAFKVNQTQFDKPLILQSNQVFNDQDLYLIHVKEKSSKHLLKLTGQNYFDQQQGDFSVKASLGKSKLLDKNTSVQLIAPNGQVEKVKFSSGKVQLPDNMENFGAYNGLYEIELTTQKKINNRIVKRTAKLPFIQVAQTAELKRNNTSVLSLDLSVYTPGRYAVTATLNGYDKSGKETVISTVETAQHFKTDGTFLLPLNLTEVSNQGYQGPFTLSHIKLMDQSRMMLLQQTETE